METFAQEGLSGGPDKGHYFPGKSIQEELIDTLFYKVVKDSDYPAFEQLFNKMYEPLCHFCLKFVLVKEVAEELVSDVFYSIWKNRKVLLVSSPRPYLFTSVRNRSYDYLRKTKKSVLCDLDKASNIPTSVCNSQERLIEIELSRQVDNTISHLPKQCKLIFELSRDHGMRYRDIAATLNISIKTVETQMGRALKHLRKSLPTIT